MKLTDLSPVRRAWLETCLYDSLIEKHEGPWDWGGYLLDSEDHAAFLVLGGYEVLLPVPADHNPYLTVLYSIADAAGQFVTLWLKDMYLASRYPSYTEEDAWSWLPPWLRRRLPFLPPPTSAVRTFPPSVSVLDVRP